MQKKYLCQKYNDRIEIDKNSCPHPDDYCRYRTSCMINMLCMENSGCRVKRRKSLKMPDEYICNMCGFMFLSGETVNIFCPECGSSMVAKEVCFDEYFDEEATSSKIRIINI